MATMTLGILKVNSASTWQPTSAKIFTAFTVSYKRPEQMGLVIQEVRVRLSEAHHATSLEWNHTQQHVGFLSLLLIRMINWDTLEIEKNRTKLALNYVE